MHQERDLFFRMTKRYSRGWNITERVNGNVGNEIKLGMMIQTIRSRILQVSYKQREYDIDVYSSTTKDLLKCTWIIMALHVPDDHSLERSLGDV
jgi:hypothetical protein